jgi:ABC-type Fe3+/spermidine/putrescine transport system ATPase subunit
MTVSQVSHRYSGQESAALDSIDLDFAAGQFVSLLGPSGCGKTTLLRILAGFIQPTGGRVLLDGADVTDVPPNRRDTNLVFQRPTLFPHLNVAENIAFGLRLSGTPKAEIERRVGDMLAMVRLPDFQQRRVNELSGGQMQRIALARALVNRPRVVLMDEPLSALDLAVRLELEVELRRMHRELGSTFIYVTHDQREALALSDRIVVFDKGVVVQQGAPAEVYSEPQTEYVAKFVGDANAIACTVSDSVATSLGGVSLPTPLGAAAGPALLVIRREQVVVSAADGTGQGMVGEVVDVAYRGGAYSYAVACRGLDRPIKCEQAGTPFVVGDEVCVSWSSESARILPASKP